MDIPDLPGEFFIVPLTETDWVLQPAIVSAAGKMKIITESLNRILFFFRQFFDRLIFVQMPSQRQRSFISNSLTFFNRSFSI